MLHIEVDEGVYFNLFSALWRVDPKGNFLPDLAAEIPTLANGGISADGLSWRIKLRDNVKWHDGTPFTAEDVKFNLDLINNPKFAAGRRAGHELVRDIKVVSPTEITWRMERPYAPYPSILSWTFIVPEAHPREGGRSQHHAKLPCEPRRHRPVQMGGARARRPHHARRLSRAITAAAPISSG